MMVKKQRKKRNYYQVLKLYATISFSLYFLLMWALIISVAVCTYLNNQISLYITLSGDAQTTQLYNYYQNISINISNGFCAMVAVGILFITSFFVFGWSFAFLCVRLSHFMVKENPYKKKIFICALLGVLFPLLGGFIAWIPMAILLSIVTKICNDIAQHKVLPPSMIQLIPVYVIKKLPKAPQL